MSVHAYEIMNFSFDFSLRKNKTRYLIGLDIQELTCFLFEFERIEQDLFLLSKHQRVTCHSFTFYA